MNKAIEDVQGAIECLDNFLSLRKNEQYIE